MKVDEIQIYDDIYSPLKAAHHMKDIEKIRKGETIPPKFLMIHPEAWCSNDCSFCAYRNSNWQKEGMDFLNSEWVKNPEDQKPGQQGKPKGQLVPGVSGLPKEIALNLPTQMYSLGIPACEITGSGEPTLYPYIKELFEKLKSFKIETALVTHGQTLGSILDANVIDNLQWIRFSMDSYTPKTHAKVHGVNTAMFPKAIQNIKRSIDLFPDSVIGISFIVTKDNYYEILKAAQFYRDLGVNSIRYSFEYEPSGTANLSVDQMEQINSDLETVKRLYQDKEFKVFGQIQRIENYKKQNTDFTFCGYMLFSYNIGYNGLVYPCCVQIYNKGYEFGDLNKQKLADIIYGEERKKYIEQFDVKKCHNCWLRDKNIALETLIAPEKRLGHVNFV